MPTYQYRCAKCREQFEVWQSIHDDSLTTHDGDCGGSLAKVLAVGGIVLKGPGFYRTDSRASSGSQDGRGKDGGERKESKEKESAGTNGAGDKASDSGTGEKKDSKKSESKAPASKSDAAKT